LCFGKEDESSFSNESRLRDEVRKENEVLFDPFAVAWISEEAQVLNDFLRKKRQNKNGQFCLFLFTLV